MDRYTGMDGYGSNQLGRIASSTSWLSTNVTRIWMELSMSLHLDRFFTQGCFGAESNINLNNGGGLREVRQ